MSNDHTSTEQLLTSNGDNQDADGCSGQGVAYNVQVRPMITPNVFNGESSEKWDEWVEHFESISRVNKWDQGRIQGGGLWGLETPPPQYIREAKGMMCCYKNT